MLNDSRVEFERWFRNHYRAGHQPSGNPLDYSLAKDGTGGYLCLRAAVAWIKENVNGAEQKKETV